VLVGLGALIVGVASQLIVIGVIGFVVMLGGVVLAVTPTRGIPRDPVDATPATPKPRANSSFMDRMNERWDRRQEGP